MAARKRRKLTKLKVRHHWEGPIEGWTKNYIAQHVWRTLPDYGYSELLHECYLKFAVCQSKYKYVRESKHFMALYKTAARNHINDLASARVFMYSLDWGFEKLDQEGTCTYHQTLENEGAEGLVVGCEEMEIIAHAPPTVRAFLRLMLDSVMAAQLWAAMQPVDTGKKLKQRPVVNTVVCRFLKLDPNTNDVIADVKKYLRGG